MNDLRTIVHAMRRPRLLVRAARLGLAEYRRDRDLKRLTRATSVPCPSSAVAHLIEEERELERTRKNGDASYSVVRHVDVLIALMAEARLLPVAEPVRAVR